jgi:hypothetical protein
MTTLIARNFSLEEVHQLLKLQKLPAGAFPSSFGLDALTAFEREELEQIQRDFDAYLSEGKVLEGMVKALTLFPLMRLAGFYRSPIKISLEEEIERISILDEDIDITGRMDILAVNNAQSAYPNAYFWVLVIEAKNSEIAPTAGLAQLLTYAYKSLEHRDSLWGLTTNGALYQFVHLQKGNPSTYQLMPILNLFEPQPSIQLLQVLKAICKLP